MSEPTVVAVPIDGGSNSPGTPDGPDGEVMLDVEVAGSVAPGATIAVYFAPNTDQGFIDAVTSAVHDTSHRPSVVSISWGGAERTWTAQAMNQMEQAFSAVAAMGVTVTVAAGDNGSSDVFPVPAYQHAASIPPSANPGGRVGRGVPDICGDADPDTGYTVRVDGQTIPIGGTSAVAPLWAGLVALLNQGLGRPVGFLHPFLYSSAGSTALHDVVTGSNAAYTAGPGGTRAPGLVRRTEPHYSRRCPAPETRARQYRLARERVL